MLPVYFSKPAVLASCANSSEELWSAVTSGDQSGIKKVTALNGKEFFAARINEEVLSEKSTARYDMRILRIEEKCLLQIEDVIFKAKELYGENRIGVCVGSCDNGTEFSIAGHRKYFANQAFSSDYSLEMQGADYVSTFIAEKYGLKGPCMTFSTACSSSAGAIIKASELIRSGICDAVICGGVDIASDTTLLGFDSLEAIASEITNPFSKNRHGITLGDAAAFFLLSKDSSLVKNDSEKVVELLGYGESADAYHMTSPDPSGDGAKRAMQKALDFAELTARDIDYVNLHGTGTKFNDSMEAKALDSVFASYKVPCSSTKPLTGHTLGAAGALEAAICYMAITKNSKTEKKFLPLQVWDQKIDPELPLLKIISKSDMKIEEPSKIQICMSNSFAFGGSNASLILGVR